MNEDQDIIELPIDGVLDLHTFSPKEVKYLIFDYIEECLKREIMEVHIIHGKGKGVLRRIVHSVLDKHPNVQSYGYGSSWGVTVVTLKK